MLIGKTKEFIDTPALWVDLDIMERNITRLAAFFREAGVSWRPHVKGIKVPAIAHKLLAAGAIGVTCAKLSEVEVMAAAGIGDILVANQVVGAQKIARLTNLRRHADVAVAIDDLENARAISQAASDKGVRIRVLVEVNIGMNRCGVDPGQPTLELVQQATGFPGLELAGIIGWEGHLVRTSDAEEKRRRCVEAVGSLVKTAALCRQAGFPLPIVSCGGSGTYQYSARVPGVTEIQAGGAVLGDLAYRDWGVELDCALFILATVISRPAATRAIVDAGRKAMNAEIIFPEPVNLKETRLVALNAEHGILKLDDLDTHLSIGDKIDFRAGYGDMTLCLHDRLFGLRGDEVEIIWDIQGRGKLT